MEITIGISFLCLIIAAVALSDIKNFKRSGVKPSEDTEHLKRLRDIREFEFYRDIQSEQWETPGTKRH